MQEESETLRGSEGSGVAWSDLPDEELRRYAASLGLELGGQEARPDIVRRIRERQELLLELDHGALVDLVEWGRCPVANSASKEELAREIARIENLNYEGLTHRGLAALASLRGVPCAPADDAGEIIARLRKRDGFWKSLRRRRRAWVGSLVEKLVSGRDSRDAKPPSMTTEPRESEPKQPREALRKQIEDHGLVSGLANRLRGAADDYVRLKLDEIEARIDAKLDQIDKRLAEWRDREVANRLKILRITLVFTVLVAILSLGYNLLKARMGPPAAPPARQSSVEP